MTSLAPPKNSPLLERVLSNSNYSSMDNSPLSTPDSLHSDQSFPPHDDHSIASTTSSNNDSIGGKGKGKGKSTAIDSADGNHRRALKKRRKKEAAQKDFQSMLQKGKLKIKAPGTAWDEVDLSDTFFKDFHLSNNNNNNNKDHKTSHHTHGHKHEHGLKTWLKKKRSWFLMGGLMGAALALLLTRPSLPLDLNLDNFDTQISSLSLSIDQYLTTLKSDLNLNLPDLNFSSSSLPPAIQSLFNLTETVAEKKDSFLKEDFGLGREAKEVRGFKNEFAVVLVPGIVSSGLESWSTTPEAAPYFRQRLWGTNTMIRAMLTRRQSWMRSMRLDDETGLDYPGHKVRAAQGLDAALTFGFGYWIWSPMVQHLAALGYDYTDLHLAAYDWRLSFHNLQVRDQYFSRLKTTIEHDRHILGKKTVLISHSMGSLVAFYFMKWVEAKGFGEGGPDWVENHIEAFVTIGGTMLGVAKASAALLSGEMLDTVEMPSAGAYLLERFFSRKDRADLFRSWAGSASMLLKGGTDVWGDANGAPDDPENRDSDLTYGHTYLFKQHSAESKPLTSQTVRPNLTAEKAFVYMLQSTPTTFQKMLADNYSVGIERDEEAIKRNDGIHQKWSNPLEARLPYAPSMKIHCMYGVGKDTERAYFYQRGPYGKQEPPIADDPQCEDIECTNQTQRTKLDLPLGQTTWIDTSINLDTIPKVRSGVLMGEGDGTVPLLSLGAMCVEGWKRDIYNPARIQVKATEFLHQPVQFDPRGGPATADHIDILGSTSLNEAIINVVSNHSDLVPERFHSRIREYAKKIRWEVNEVDEKIEADRNQVLQAGGDPLGY